MAALLVLSSWQTGAATEELKEGQRKAVIMVVSITGNELTYYEVEDTEEGKAEKRGTEESETEENETKERGTEESGTEEGELQGTESEQVSGSGENQKEAKNPSDGNAEKPERGEMPEGFAPGRMENGEMPESFASGQTQTVYLPVAAAVHTDTGEEMTFSILEAGDELEVLFEEVDGEEVIAEIWMTDTAGENT